ncbi:MAG: GIY-YIG nuclease family protein [Nitrospiria bacterium]
MKNWSLYLIRTRDRALYAGITTDVPRRFSEHVSARAKGAKYLRAKSPFELVYHTKIGSRALALKAEYAVKKLPKTKKEALIAENPECPLLLEILGLSHRSEST